MQSTKRKGENAMRNLTMEEKIVKLIKKSNLRGGTDNVSIAYLEKESGE